ncbi:hypothetical protein [Azospirillum sp. TSO5]|uniref:hypothetical protein n=1 Tax=Azospirillum sp. TSO5 TaxID=716760 RepID=UPI000D617F76|nr:hypothetical protein [Azospirillum sp. TSO5]PWC97720.1 hypothetical protein TSO5_04255 [Azospirillum sp. TSO5]
MKRSHAAERTLLHAGMRDGNHIWTGGGMRRVNKYAGVGASVPGSLRRAAKRIGDEHGLTPQQVIAGVNRAAKETDQ